MTVPALLDGRTVLVTGAGQGLGATIAATSAAAGARVLVTDLRRDTAEATADALRAAGHDAVAQVLDVRDERSVEDAVTACTARWGRLNVVVNNASVLTPVTIRRMDLAAWQRVQDVHLTGTWLVMKAASTPMRAQHGGAIVNISSIVARTGGVAQAHYAAAKAGVIGLTKSAAREWGRDGARVNAVAPGVFLTPTSAAMSEAAWAERIAATALGRAGEPDELAAAVLFLASDLASYVTGTVLDVTGGRDM